MLSKLTYVVLNSEFFNFWKQNVHYIFLKFARTDGNGIDSWSQSSRDTLPILWGRTGWGGGWGVGGLGVGVGGGHLMKNGWRLGRGVWILGRGTRKYKKKGGREAKWAGAGRLNPRGSPISPRYPMLSTWRCKEAGHQQLRCWHDSLGISQFQQQNYSR